MNARGGFTHICCKRVEMHAPVRCGEAVSAQTAVSAFRSTANSYTRAFAQSANRSLRPIGMLQADAPYFLSTSTSNPSNTPLNWLCYRPAAAAGGGSVDMNVLGLNVGVEALAARRGHRGGPGS